MIHVCFEEVVHFIALDYSIHVQLDISELSPKSFVGESHSLVVNPPDCDNEVSEFKLQSWYYVHIWLKYELPYQLHLLFK